MKPINITSAASADGLKEKLEEEARRRGMNFRNFVGDIYNYAVRNKRFFKKPLGNPRRKGGKHIGAVVSDQTAKELTNWALEKKTSRGDHCRYLLEMAIEGGHIDKIFGVSE